MRNNTKQSGVAAIELVLILLALILIGFVGYRVYDARQTADEQLNQSATGPGGGQSSGTRSSADLNLAETSLDQVNPEDSSSELSELDSQLSGF